MSNAITQIKELLPARDWRQPTKNKRRYLFDSIVSTTAMDDLWPMAIPDGCECLESESDELCEACNSQTAESHWQRFKKIFPPLPDGMLVSRELRECVAIEIEDSNPLSEDHLMNYHEALWELDAVRWGLHLMPCDRYGNFKPVDLLQFAATYQEHRAAENTRANKPVPKTTYYNNRTNNPQRCW